MGYDSSIEIKKEEIEEVEQVLKKIGFELASSKSSRFQLFLYRKYIDENCKYKEGTLFGVSKIKGKYYICGRNSIGCTGYDLSLHNETIIYLSKHFNRDYSTDEGTNKPFKIYDLVQGLVNGLAFPYEQLHNEFEELLYFISCIKPISEQQKAFNKLFGGFTPLNQESFSMNVLIIYLVSILETYFKSTFMNILKCLSEADFDRIESLGKIKRYAIQDYDNGKISKYEKVASGFSFQNIENITKTYQNCFNIDLNVILNKNTILKRKKYDIFDDLFFRRHKNVHELNYDFMTKEKFLKYYSIVAKSLNEIYSFLCKEYNVKRVEGYLSRTSYNDIKQMIDVHRKM